MSCAFELPPPAKRHHSDFAGAAAAGPRVSEPSAAAAPAAAQRAHASEPASRSSGDGGVAPAETSASELLRQLRELDVIGDADGGIPSFLGQQRPPTYATTFVATGSADGAVRLWKAPAIAHMRQQSGWKCTQTETDQ